MSLSIQLLRVIGSPFTPSDRLPRNSEERLTLYTCARKNKMGLLYLDTLRVRSALMELEQDYERELAHYQIIQETALHVAQLLSEKEVSYAIFKTLKPFVSTNDVDILLLGEGGQDYQVATDALLAAGYELVEEAPLQTMFHDPRGGAHDRHALHKDPYDVDLYQEASASHIVYMRKSALLPHVTSRCLGGQAITVLKTEAEVVVNLDHGVFPEQLYTLGDYYTALQYLAEGDEDWPNRMWQVARAGRSVTATTLFWQLTAALHREAHGFVPAPLEAIVAQATTHSAELSRLRDNRYQTPHKYALSTVAWFLLEKARDSIIARSLLRQALRMLDPRLAKHVFQEFVVRRQRESY